MPPLRLSYLSITALSLLLAACGGGGGGGSDEFGEPIAFMVGGSVTYEDKLYDGSGFTGTEFKPVRHARVEIVSDSGSILASGYTNADGGYSLDATGGGDLRLRIYPQSDTGATAGVTVLSPDSSSMAASKSFTVSDASLRVDAEIGTDTIAGAFNILDLFTRAGEFVQAMESAYPPALRVYWEPGSSDGTYFTNADGIHVLGGTCTDSACTSISGDTDEFDDDVLLHEYGHFLEYHYSTLDSPGGWHVLSGTTQDLRLAWSEGWSNFASGGLKAWLADNAADTLSTSLATSYYVDTYYDLAFSFDFDSTNPSDSGEILRYASSEGAVAKVLWNLHNNFGIANIWAVFAGTLSSSGYANSLETFWDGWLATHPADDALSQFQEREVDYSEDGQEADDSLLDTPQTLAAPAPGFTLYKESGIADTDLIRLDATNGTTYRIETYNLKNGTDTVIQILDAGGNSLGNSYRNDNHDETAPEDLAYCEQNLLYPDSDPSIYTLICNDGCNLASRLDFTAPATATYYVQITTATTADERPLFAGRYGSYDVKISTSTATAQCS